MNYPIWDIPAPGLLIALVAITHVFVSHFAVGGGLFLVWTERKARREGDAVLLEYVRRHSRFFILLTLVFGAITGVGIWFTIGLVHPSATSSLINTFVWGWAIEWVFFFTEIAAAMVYYYGWDRLSPRNHMIVGWIYFWAAWASLVVINGILTYMLTPGDWLTTHGFFDGFLNPTYWPALLTRTLGSIGLAGVYALMTSSWVNDDEFGRRVSRYATLWWIVPMAIGLPFGLVWFFSAANGAGVPTAEILGAAGPAMTDFLQTLVPRVSTTGYPTAQTAFRVAFAACAATIVLALAGLAIKRAAGRRFVATILMIAAFASVGGAEWFREDLRKPWVIGSYMFVNSVRLPDTTGRGDAFAIDRLHTTGVLAAAKWSRLPAGVDLASMKSVDEEAAVGKEVFRLLCTQCHTVDGYVAIRPLVAGWNTGALEGVIDRLAVPSDKEKGWTAVPMKVDTWRGRRMPPFAGNEAEERALAVYLATLGGGAVIPKPAAGSVDGAAIFEANCSACHGDGSDWPIEKRVAGKTRDQIHDALGHLDTLNADMPPFEGSDAERDALADYLAGIAAGGKR
ncbi:MAG: c-type cytochrome [Thermoanaerobaculia bacterium]|jgi:mono/diheme cytochrome c family protein